MTVGGIKRAGEKLEAGESLTLGDVGDVGLDILGVVPGGALVGAAIDVGTAALRGGRAVDKVSGAVENGVELYNFTTKTAGHMANPDRYVPVHMLDEAIKGSKGVPDPRGSRGTMHHMEMYRNGKPYKLEVLHDKQTNSIWHFKYE